MKNAAKKGHNQTNGIAGDQLLAIIQRVERLEEEKAGIASDIKDVLAEAKGNGFDVKTIRRLIKLRQLTQAERDEEEALLDIYKAAIGMLGGTPLGEAALRKLSELSEEDEEQEASPAASDSIDSDRAPDSDNAESSASIDDAREMARKAVEAGEPVTKNPFPARDPRRAAWDETWCRHKGSDGMEIPDAWRRQKRNRSDDQEAA
jgi:uncharacterized protein (UPF0335 family)